MGLRVAGLIREAQHLSRWSASLPPLGECQARPLVHAVRSVDDWKDGRHGDRVGSPVGRGGCRAPERHGLKLANRYEWWRLDERAAHRLHRRTSADGQAEKGGASQSNCLAEPLRARLGGPVAWDVRLAQAGDRRLQRSTHVSHATNSRRLQSWRGRAVPAFANVIQPAPHCGPQVREARRCEQGAVVLSRGGFAPAVLVRRARRRRGAESRLAVGA